jgi:glycerol-3-phosphate acyltransferase PlsY
MQISVVIICVLVGYLIGSISLPRLVTRVLAPDQNLEQVELKNYSSGGTFQLKTVGATTASMILGPKVGGLIGILDILKGAIPSLVIRLLFPDQPYFIFLGAAVVCGHIWPVYFRFRGGGGLSPALGVFLVLDPLGVLISVLLAFVIGMLIMRQIEFAVMGGPIIFIFWVALRSGNWLYIIFSILINVLMIIAIIPDILVNVKARREGTMDMSVAMDEIPMGKMMNKMMDKMGLSKEKKDQK